MIEVLSGFSHEGGAPLNPQREPVAGDVVQITQGGAVIEQRYTPPPPPSPPPPPQITLSKADFLRRFTPLEIAAFNRRRKEAQALAPAEYSDPAKAALVALETFLVLFDAVSDLRLWHADTAGGLDVLAANGIIAAGRKAQILDPTA
jgi:hypothetical protein